MPKKEKVLKNPYVCYWQSDGSPQPLINEVDVMEKKDAEKWLKRQEKDEHWTAKIDPLTVELPSLEEVKEVNEMSEWEEEFDEDEENWEDDEDEEEW
jgi:hypothetical protein